MKRNDRRRILAAVALAAALTLFLCGCSGAETASGDFAAFPSAEPQYVGAWPENDLTARIPEPQDGAIDYVRDFSDDGKYEIVWDFGSDAAFEEYIMHCTRRDTRRSPLRRNRRHPACYWKRTAFT